MTNLSDTVTTTLADPSVGLTYKDILTRIEADPDFAAQLERYQAQQKRLCEEEDRRDALERAELRFKSSDLPRRFVDQVLGGKCDAEAHRVARDFIAGSDWLLVLAGNKGLAKTSACATAVYQLLRQRALESLKQSNVFAKASSVVVFLTAPQLARYPRFDDEAMAKIERCSLLIVDDVGTEFNDRGGAFSSLLDGVVNARYADGRKTILTTNCTLTEFKTRYGVRILDRLKDGGRFYVVSGNSLRGGGR